MSEPEILTDIEKEVFESLRKTYTSDEQALKILLIAKQLGKAGDIE